MIGVCPPLCCLLVLGEPCLHPHCLNFVPPFWTPT